ncbi:MAG: TonB C-terminal domain-containing protein [Sandaracinus sp.]
MPPPSPSSRIVIPSAAVLVGALVFSLGAHMQAYVGLGELRALLASSAHDAQPSSEIEFVLTDPPESPTPVDAELAPTEEPTADAEEPPPEHRERRRPERPHPRAPTPQAPPPTPPEPQPEAQQPAPPATEVTPPAPQTPPPLEQRASVVQQSDNPDQPPPPDAQYLAEQNRTVEEETMAQITSRNGEANDPHTGPPEDAVPAETTGDSSEHVVAESRDSEGSDERLPTPEEEDRIDPRDATDDPSRSPRPQVASGTDASSEAESMQVEHGTPSTGDEGGVRALGGQPTTEVLVSDGFGSYTVRVPVPGPSGDGGGDAGGHHREGPGRGIAGLGPHSGHVGREGGSPLERGSSEREGPQLGVSYAALEAVYGEEQLERERHARLERRRSHARGSASQEIWDSFRAASENYIAGVRPGNQTALNAAASPFARFLHDMHIRIHAHFVDRFIASLPLDATDPRNDMNLHATLEIAVNPDGTIFQVGIVETSGQTLFDLGAFTAVYRAQPFPRPPSIILSGDGHAWLHWRFDRGPRQCGTWNAEPFLLDNGDLPPEASTDEHQDTHLDLEHMPSGDGIELAPPAPISPVPP